MLAEGLNFVAQPAAALAAVRAAIPRDPWRLGALNAITTLTGSALIALAVLAGRLTAEEAWAAAHVDEDWNMDFWGRDELALERRAAHLAEMKAAAMVLDPGPVHDRGSARERGKMKDIVDKLDHRRSGARAGGGAARIEAQHKRGKLTARERMELLMDKGSFEEFDMFVEHRSAEFGMEKTKIPGDGVVTGWGTVNGRTVFAFAKDFTVFGGSLSEAHAQKIVKIQDLAMKARRPDRRPVRCRRRPHPGRRSGARRLRRGLQAQRDASGVIPQISVIMGPCAGGDVYSPAMTDFIFMVRDTSYMFVTGPDVVKTVTNEVVTAEEFGGATSTPPIRRRRRPYENDVECILQMRRLIDFLPPNSEPAAALAVARRHRARGEIPRHARSGQSQQALRHQGADPKVVDEGDFFEIQAAYAMNIVTGFGRIAGARWALSPTSPCAGRRARFGCEPQSSALRAFLRCLRHSDRHLRGRARLLAGDRPGIWRPDQARRQAVVRLQPMQRAAGHGDHSQGVRRRL